MKVIVLTGPSGCGKNTIINKIVKHIPDAQFLTSATTRPKREGEIDGKNYHFLSERDFKERIKNDEFVEYEEVYSGVHYGTLKHEVELKTKIGPVISDIDVFGASKYKKFFGKDALVIFIKPPSGKELLKRLKKRASESPETLMARLSRHEEEMKFEKKFDAVVLNDKLSDAVKDTMKIVEKFLKK